MNLFVTSLSPKQAVKSLDTKRLNKMILETAQMMSTALRCYHCSDSQLYKKTHENHPVSIWVRETKANYMWTLTYLVSAIEEYFNRRGVVHKSHQLVNIFWENMKLIPDGNFTDFANCTPFKGLDVLKAYKLTLIEKWLMSENTITWE